jgi:pseudouridine-5'-phosphate glycosidase
MPLHDYLQIAPGVRLALEQNHPVIALETTVITHGLPRPQNYDLARTCETAIRDEGVVPAMIAVMDGAIRVGLDDDSILRLAEADAVRKVSRRDFGIALARRELGGTTVAGTMIAAHMAGIRVFATGGIGGVHRGDALDISADLPELGRTPVAVVCAGAKSILDLPRTLEYLETVGVPVIGFGTDTFPAFYASSSGLPVDVRADTPGEVADILRAGWESGISGGVLVVVPPPPELALPAEEMEAAIREALAEADKAGISGKAISPFLLNAVSRITEGRSLAVNIALLENNARVAARIAQALAQDESRMSEEGLEE